MSTVNKNALSTSKLSSSKEYREKFVAAFLKRSIPFQVRTIRKKRNLTQPDLAKLSKITQGVISRVEDPDNGNLTLNTVLNIAAGYDLAFIGKFVTFSQFLREVEELSEESMNLPCFEEECAAEIAAEPSLLIRVDANIHAPCLTAGPSALDSAKQTNAEFEIGVGVIAKDNFVMPGRKPMRNEWKDNLSSTRGNNAANQNSARPSGLGI